MDINLLFDILTITIIVFYGLFALYIIQTFLKNKRDIYVNAIVWAISFLLLFTISIIRLAIAIELNLPNKTLLSCCLLYTKKETKRKWNNVKKMNFLFIFFYFLFVI